MTILTVFVAGTSFGILIGAAAALAIQKRQAAFRRDLSAELRRPADLEPCEFTALWQERV